MVWTNCIETQIKNFKVLTLEKRTDLKPHKEEPGPNGISVIQGSGKLCGNKKI